MRIRWVIRFVCVRADPAVHILKDLRSLECVICPKCQSVMKTVDKNGIHIDQCEGCHGIFLDPGEREQIVGAESSYYGNGRPRRPTRSCD